MKKLLLISLLGCLAGCNQFEPTPVIMRVDDFTTLSMTDEEAHYQIRVVNIGRGDTINVIVDPATYSEIISKKTKKTFTLKAHE